MDAAVENGIDVQCPARGNRIEVELGPGFPFAQVYAPASPAVVALEPMTAPTNALGSGDGLRLVEPGASFTASFRIGVRG